MDHKQNVQGLKTIDPKLGSFQANGVEYFIEKSISFERYLMYQKLQIQCGYEVGFYGIFEKIKKIYELCNLMKFADIAVLTHNIMQGVKGVDDRKIPILELCALFINSKDENRNIINDDMVQVKINNWQAEGLDIFPFFQLALGSIQHFSSVYNELSQTISESQEEKKS